MKVGSEKHEVAGICEVHERFPHIGVDEKTTTPRARRGNTG